ncbi:dystrophin, isoforms A/C/F/G/H-like isoform X25 [Macrobrachium rosenbergii]|uniref:dystrophin, isoforms A/C/F/G/H-like isoform X25 n=1 Tax=Macrobrachium rosenbergii TaxID=79674 RepID=UPI0034D67F1E
MSDQGKKPNLRDLTSRLGQIQQRVVTIDPASPNSTPENTGEVRRYVKIDVSEGNNAKACDNVPEGNVSATYGVQESTENEEGDGSTIKEFVHEVEFQHNTLLGKMQMLRDVLAKQLNQSQVQSSLNEAQKDANQSQAEQTQSQLGAVQTPDLQDQSEVVQNMSQTDEREDIQKKTFAKWINSQLVKGQHAPVTDLFYDLRDGTRLLALLEVLTNKTFKREKGRMRVHHLNNVSRALAILEDNNVKLVNISNEHIVDGSAKLTLGLVWAIILHWQVQGVLKDVMSDLQQTNLEKTLLAWCRQTTKGYHGVDVQNFTTSWTDGLAFNALIHSHRPHLFDWTVLARKHPYARLENAFRVAHEHLSIERLLDPEDVNSQVPDKKSIMMYVMCLFQALPHASFTMESLDLSVQSDSSFSVEASSDDVPMSTKKNRPLSNVSIGLGEYQHTLEEVLTWLLGAEDRLAAMPPIAESTDEVKDQFHDLEELMLELTSKQGGIGDVLGEGSRLLREGVMEEEEEEEVRVQMKLLNTRWEELRVKAMDRQSKLHEKLMALQQNQLDSLKRWLTETEDRIANMSQVGPTLEALEEQIAAHQSLQADLEKEQSNINSLSNMVVVVDESSSDAAYSSLEDELNALGERWAHICKWTESRWNMLQNLSVYWKALDQGMVKMRQWMDEKETLLRQVESNPSTEQEHILQQASMLQVLQAELEVQQRCLGHLQEHSANVASHLPSDSDIQEKMSVELENIQDRMDILVSIIEAQTQRLAASGIDITKVVIPGKDSTDVVSSSTTTISSEGGTVVTKIITTKVVTTETVEVEGSGIKRQKLEGGCQEDFSVALHQLGGWMDMIEEKTKPRPVEELTLEQLMQLVQQLESEMETQKEEYYKVVSLGQSAISETSTIGESSQESEKQVAGITTRWEALIEMLVEIRTRVTYLTQKKKISTDLSDLEVHYQEFLRWCDDMQTISENEPNAIKLHLEQCQSKLNAMKNREEELKCIMKAAESLDGKWTQETHILIEEIKIIITKWEVLVQRLFERRKTLTQKVEEVQSASVTPKALAVPPESLLKAIEASREWLCSLETAIASECVVAPLPQMQDVFEKFKDLSQKVDTEQGNMAYINDACNSVSKDSHPEVLESVSKLNNQWELTTSDLKSRIKTIEKLIERQKQYNDEVTGLKSWLAEVDIFLQAEEAALGDIETLEAQLEQSNALQDDIATLQNNFNNISTTGKQLLEEGNEELKTMVKSQLEELTARWDTVTEQARVQNKSLKEALAKSQKVHEDIEKLSTWLDDVEKRIPSSLTTDKEEELNSGIETFSQLRDEISKHSEDFRALNNIGDEMLQLDAAATHEELARQFTQLNGRWTEVVSQVDSKYKTLTTAAQQYEDFKKYCAEEKDWLDQLQAGLEKSTKSAADAEEISEALDELEIFLHSHNEERLEQIRKLAESLVSENVMADSVQEITQSLTTRFETLNAQATEQQSGLEGRVQEAQAWEREYISVLDYLAQSDLLLTQAIADPTLQVDPVQVQSELAVQQEVLKKMQKQVEVYHSQGKTEAAVRLEDQVTHLLKKYEEIEMKLRLVQKPSDFDERLENVSKQLKDIHEKVHLTSIGSGNPDVIQEQLNQCMSIYQLLSEIKAEVENVIATGRKIVKDGQSTDPDGLTQQLDQLKALYNQLGGAVTEQRGTLERTLRHSRKVQKDAGHLEEWLTTTESELDQREATVPTKCIQAELHFAQHAIDDLGRKKPLLTGLHESYAALTSVCDDSTVLQPVKEQVDDIALTWERVSTRLTNRLKNMQSEQVSKEADMEKFIVGLGEIKGWLESTEHQLGNLGKMEPNDQAKLVKAVASEVQNYKSHIENIRDTAVDLINHGTLFQARVQPELVQINQRWENIFKTVQVKCEECDGSLNYVSLKEADAEVSHDKVNTGKVLQGKEQAIIPNVKETGTASCIIIGSDVGIKKRKRFAKIYEEGDGTILTEMTKGDDIQKRLDSEEKKAHSAHQPFESKSSHGAIAKETLITPDSIEKALLRKGVMERREVCENWELSSSSSSISQSKRESSTEGSIDFGSETRGTLSGDWDDAPVITDVNTAEEMHKIQEGNMEVIDELEESEDVRFSFLSSNSIDTDRDEIFTNEMESETPMEGEGIDSSSSDESDSAGEPSTTRISAATIYEQAVIQALEGSDESKLVKKDDQEGSSIVGNETCLLKAAVEIREAERDSSFLPERKSGDLQTGMDSQDDANAKVMSAQDTQNVKDTTVSKSTFKGTASSPVLPQKDDVVEIVYEVVTVTRSKVVAVPEMATILHLPDESDLSEETDVSEEQKGGLVPLEVKEQTFEVVAPEQCSAHDEGQKGTRLISSSLVGKNKDSSLADKSGSAKSKEGENLPCPTQHRKADEVKGKQSNIDHTCDQEQLTVSHTDTSYPLGKPQYSGSVQEEKKMFEKTAESSVGPSLITDVICVDVTDETKEASANFEIAGNFKGHKISHRTESKYHSGNIDDEKNSSLEGLLPLPHEKTDEEVNKKMYQTEDQKETSQPARSVSRAHENTKKLGIANIDETHKVSTDVEALKKENCRKLSVTSSSSSSSSFEMVDNEMEVDLEDQLSSHESYCEPRNEGKENISGNGSESDEGLDTLEEPDTFELQKGLGPTCIPLDVKLERHVSIDSSVSTLSEAETVIHVPIESLSQADTETTSVKDDSQIGVKAVKRGDVNESLIRSVSEELITKTSDSENELLSRDELADDKEAVLKENPLQIGIDNKGVTAVVAKTDAASSEDYVIITKEKSLKGEVDQAFVCATISPIEDDISPDNEDSDSSPFEILDRQTVNKRYVVYDSSKSKPSPSKLLISNIPHQSESSRQPALKKVEKSVKHEESLDSMSIGKSDVAYPGLDMESTVNTSVTVGDIGQHISDTDDGDGWINIGVLAQTKSREKQVSVDVAQVIQRTEVSEEQEVSISIPDTHLEDSKGESSASSDDEIDYKVSEITKRKSLEEELSDFLIDSKHSAGKTKEFETAAENRRALTEPLKDPGSNDTKESLEGKTKKPNSLCLLDSTFEDDGKPKTVCDNKLNKENDQEEEMTFSKCVLKDTDYVVVDDCAELKVEEHKLNKGKESSSSCDTSNSTGSSPYYDASGEMVESLGSDEVSSSMEVLHSSAEILDMPMASWTSSVDFESPNHEELNEVCDHGPAPPRETKKSRSLWNEQEHTAPSRFSTISACTDASEEVIFSETEGEELPYEDTTDDDLTLEEEAIKELAEKHKEALPSTTQAFQTVTTSETVFAMRSYVKETTKKQSEAGKDDDEGYLAEVSRLAEKIGELRNKTKVTPSYEEALEKAEALEHEVAELEPDIATIISRGDTLTLTTHMVDVHKANVIRTAVNDLRNHWSALKSETEGVKANAEKVNEEVNAVSKKADDIVNWINDVSKRLHLVNNDESQLQALEKEMAKKKEELDDLNNSGALLKKYRYNHIQPILTLLNTRWTEINMQFRQYRKVSLEKKTIVSSSKVEAEVESTNVPDFVASVNRLREAISAISRQLSANKLAGNHYDNLKGQEDELKSIKGGIETLKPRVDGLEEERNATIKNVSPVQSEQVRRVMDKLREEWAQVNRGYTERHSHWLQCSENWRTLQKTIEEFSVWLTSIEEKVQTTASQSLPEAKITQKELEKQVTLKHRPSQTLQSTCKEITDAINPEEGKRLQERVDSLMKRWRSLLLDLAARREKIAGEEGSKEGSNVEYEALVTWVDQAQALMDAPVNVTDEASLSAHTTMVQNHLIEITTKQNLLKKLKDSKSKTLTPSQITLLETNMSKVVKSLPDYKNMMDTKLGVIKTLVTDVEDLYKWTEEMRVKTALHNLSEEEVKMMKITLHEKEVLYENLDSTYWVLAQDAESKGLTVAVGLKNRMNTIESRLKALQGQVLDASDRGKSTSPATSPAFSRITPAPARGTEKADEEKVVQEKQKVEVMKEAQQKTPEIKKTEMRPVSTGTTVTSSVTNVIQNVIKFEESVLSTEGDLRPPSPLVCPPKHSSDSSPALILASLDKSILQIRDWLTLMEQMTRQQTVVVGDAENIRQLTEKQKSVLRELEGKKPQLDELVASADSLKDDASRTQLHQKAAEGDAAVYKFPTHSRLFDHLRTCFKVSKLREHWDETNSVVLARKTQLDAMYGDTHKFDAKRSELESWLSRMEARLERMAPVAHTADVLDQQIREQKGFHAEIHQYKHQVELFNQMTQRLIAIYQHDDTRKLKKITETINLRYSSLNSSIIARGKALHSAMNSLHNFDKALDKFASWMSDAESNTDLIELEVDKLGPARRDPQARGPAIRLKLAHYSSYDQLQYKDLQSEIESHKDVLASLNATGQKLLGTLENQDEAVMLQRRLEEMNQRWNTLKHKSIAIRNRLEGNAENWNTLLLSLRELIEWVIRKDTELTALGPLVGDLNSLSKFSEDLAAFRRVIDEKQPVIESNLKSGRQLIASEPPLSDTSDSEAGRELDGDARYRGDDSARDLTRSVRREVAKLSEKWAALRERAAAAAAQADLAHKKLGVLQKTVEEVSGRLDEAQKTADGWGPISQDPNLADQHAHNVRKFREGLAELQRGVDDVNDQAARFSAHNVPLTPANSAKLHDLNNRWKNLETAVNDRWRQVASRSREVTPLTPAQLASSVSPPWERATTSNKVPYYINHDQESTHWDHPIMMDLLDSMNEFNHIKFSAYRTATKLRMLQKKLSLDLAKLQMATDVFDEHGLRGQNDRLIDVGDMVVVLSALYANISADHPEVNTTLAIDLCLNWLLNVYDSQRTGQMRVLSFKIGLVCLCCGHLEEKYRYMFRLIADPNRLVDQRKLGLLLHDCVQVPRQLGEVAAFGGSNIEPSVRSCFTKAGKDRETIEAVHFLAWVQQEPQSLVWLAVLHRVAASENIQHQVKCNICKAYPIVGLRYRCLKCLSFDMCQRCFFDGRSGKSHKITHPMHEYCTATTAGEDVKDFTKALKNKFKSKRSLQKHTKKGYLPVQTVLEGDPLESPSPSPQHNVTSQDMHSRLELYASRLAEVELRTNSNSTPDSEDEHGLIAQYCQSLSSSDAPLPVPRSPLQIMAAVDADQKDELEQMIRALEEENSVLQAEYDRLKSQQTVGSPPDDGLAGQRSEADMLAEAKLLRQHKGRLEARMGILEEHNRQLEAQLHRLRQLLGEPGVSSPNKSGTLQTKSVTASQLAMDSPAKVNGHSTQGGATSAYEGLEQMSEYVRPPPPPMGSVAHVGNLFSRAGDLGKAVGTLVATMTHEGASDLPSDEEEDPNASDTEEEKAV